MQKLKEQNTYKNVPGSLKAFIKYVGAILWPRMYSDVILSPERETFWKWKIEKNKKDEGN